MAVHQPEDSCASRVRNELISRPMTGIIHSRQRMAMKMRTGQVALPAPDTGLGLSDDVGRLLLGGADTGLDGGAHRLASSARK